VEERISAGPLTLKRWSVHDADALSAAILDSVHHLRPWMPWAAHEPLDPAARRALLAEWQEAWLAGTHYDFGLWIDDVVVGSGGLHARLTGPGLEISYWVHPGHLRRGYATAAARALTTAAFTRPDIEFVEIHHDRANLASARVPAALGYQRIGEQPRTVLAPYDQGITVIWRMRREAWASLQKVPRP
jgi:RimJ/RimL family protein N-acetyltransferase